MGSVYGQFDNFCSILGLWSDIKCFYVISRNFSNRPSTLWHILCFDVRACRPFCQITFMVCSFIIHVHTTEYTAFCLWGPSINLRFSDVFNTMKLSAFKCSCVVAVIFRMPSKTVVGIYQILPFLLFSFNILLCWMLWPLRSPPKSSLFVQLSLFLNCTVWRLFTHI